VRKSDARLEKRSFECAGARPHNVGMDTKRLVIELEPHSVLTLSDSKGAGVQCLEGAVWITEEDDRNDIVLAPGESHEIARRGRALVQAMGAARIAVAPAPSAAGSSGKGLQLRAPRLQAVPA
jgi:hypothetical protein